MKIKAILFDLDNTLYDFEGPHQAGISAMLRYAREHLGLQESAFYAACKAGRKCTKAILPEGASQHSRLLYLQHTLEILGISPVPQALYLEEAYWMAYLNVMELCPGISELLSNLHDQGIRIAIITDLTAAIQYRKLIHLGIVDQVDVLVTSEEAGKEKPGRKIFELVLEKLMLTNEAVLMVGDDWDKDIQGARAMDIQYIWAEKGKNWEERLRKICLSSRK